MRGAKLVEVYFLINQLLINDFFLVTVMFTIIIGLLALL